MDGPNINQALQGSNPLPPTDIRRARPCELALGWLRFLRFIRFIELQRRMAAGEPVLRIVHDDPAG